MIDVTYDISVLGSGHFLNKGRTGIARVAENLAWELADREDVELNLIAFDSIDAHLKSLHYMRDQSRLDQRSFRGAKGQSISRQTFRLQFDLRDAPFRKMERRDFLSRGKRRMLHYLHRFNNRAFRRMITQAVQSTRLLHSPYLPLPAVSAGKRGLRRFVTVHDLIPLLFPEFLGKDHRPVVAKVIENLRPDDFVFADSESTKTDLCDYTQFCPERVVVAYPAASSLFEPCRNPDTLKTIQKKYGIPDGGYVLSLSTLEPRKNIEQLIRSFRHLVMQQNIPDLNLVLVGARGWDYEGIFSSIKLSGDVARRIIVTGYVPDCDLSPLYSGAMMFAYPSLYEGFGLPPLEAMKCGVPVISSDRSSIPEVIGEAGILLDPTDGEALSQAMLELYNSSELRKALSLKSLEQAATFSWSRCADVTVNAYRSAL